MKADCSVMIPADMKRTNTFHHLSDFGLRSEIFKILKTRKVSQFQPMYRIFNHEIQNYHFVQSWLHPEAKFPAESLTVNKEPQGGQQENQ